MVGNREINNYYFFSFGSFPYGDAATNRALSYMRGLVELGCNVNLFLLGPDHNQSYLSNQKNFEYKGVKVRYTCISLFVRKGIFSKLNFLIGLLLSYIFLIKVLFQKRRKSAVFLLFVDPVLIWLYFIPIKLLGVKVFHERTEFPFLYKNTRWLFDFYINKIIPRFDGIYVISSALSEYFKTISNKPILNLPMTVEFDRFDQQPRKNDKQKYIAYCGSMYNDKDGVPDLIEAFDIVSKEYPNILLYLIGNNSDTDKFQVINNKILKSSAKDKIICTGYIERDDMPALLVNATLLALCRPSNVQAQGGFPTKLGEYLATANPVIITDVGDHSKFLKHNYSAYIAKPDNPEDFASKILDCLKNENKSKQIGEMGYKVAIEHFNYLKQAITLKKYVDSLI